MTARLLIGLLMVLTTGCVRRSLTIRTEPPGALVYVNDQLKGESPVSYDFLWYGWHRVMIRKEGFRRVDDRKRLRAPVHLWIPFDFVMELLPLTVRDVREWSYTLAPMPQPPEPQPPPLEPAAEPSADSSAPPVPTGEATDAPR